MVLLFFSHEDGDDNDDDDNTERWSSKFNLLHPAHHSHRLHSLLLRTSGFLFSRDEHNCAVLLFPQSPACGAPASRSASGQSSGM